MSCSEPLVFRPVNKSVDQPVWLSACQNSQRRQQLSEADQIRASPCGWAEKHYCHCNHSNSVNLASPTAAWPWGHSLESRLGGRGYFWEEVSCALGDAILGAAGTLAGLDTEEKPHWQKKMEGIKHPHSHPSLYFLSPSLRVNNSIKTAPEIAMMPAMMPSPGPSNHLILTKHPAHTEEQISWRCLVVV